MNAPDIVRIAGTVDDSIVDGPGIRLTIFTQGCSRQCPGCHNPQSHNYSAGEETTIDVLWQQVVSNPLLSGITLSGGEPFEQAEPLIELARRVRAAGKSVWVYSGYRFEELNEGLPVPAAHELLVLCDVLVDGPFEQALRSLDLKWRGSGNQRIIDVPASLEAGIVIEVQL